MSELYLMVAVVDRKRLPDFIKVYRAHAVPVQMIALGQGTAESEVLDVLGLSRSEKAVTLSLVTLETWSAVRRALEREIRIDVPGTGVAFTVPLSSIGGKRELLFLTEGQNFRKEEETRMKDTERELLIVMSEQGCSELVMDAARSAGARGGTVIHARGTGMERAERFLGISLASEKDVILIVVRTEERDAVMSAVMRDAGMESRAKSIVFSLPVTATAGLRLLEEEA